jgi:hypothetical protein
MTGRRRGRKPVPGSEVSREHADEVLDEALDETFPASDPPSVTRPHDLDPEPRTPPPR